MTRRGHGRVTFSTTIEVNGEEIDVDVVAEVSPYDPGCTWGPPERCYPPEGGEAEIVSLKAGDQEVELTDAQVDELCRRAEEIASEDYE